MLRSLKSPQGGLPVLGLDLLHPGWPERGASDDDPTNATLLRVRSSDVSGPLPAGWTVLRASGAEATVLILSPSWLDWRSFTACSPTLAGDASCAETGMLPGMTFGAFPGMPNPGGCPSSLTLRVPVRPPADALAGEQRVVMLRHRELCAGRVVALSGEGSRIAPDGRGATIAAGAGPAEITFTWDLARDCKCGAYDGFPPFILEGEPGTTARIQALLAAEEP